MEYKYFKKSRMYELLTIILGEEGLEKRINASYKFYRGSEWIEVGSTEFNGYYKLYRCKAYVSLDIYTYDISTDKYNCIDRKCYKSVNSISEAITLIYSRF